MGSAWDAIEIEEAGQTVARLPFTVKKRYGLRIVSQPALTQTLGPWLFDTGASYTKRLSREKDLYQRLIRGLPKFDVFQQSFHPNVTNWLPFYWQGFEQTTRYTYTIDLGQEEAQLLSQFTRQQRAGIKRAQSRVTVERSEDLEAFLDVNEKTFAVQNLAMPYSRGYVARLDEALRVRNKRFILLARDVEGCIHGGIYVAGDERRMYLLMSGTDPVYRADRAGSLLVWEAIKEAKARGVATFDFEGSMLEPVESFYRGFGAIQTPFHAVSKEPALVAIAQRLRAIAERRR